MLESLIGPDVMKKLMAKSASLISVILAWIGLIMVMMTAFIPVDVLNSEGAKTGTKLLVFHVHFWPMFVGFACAGAALIVGGVKTKINLGYVTFIASLWIMMNAIMGWVQPPEGSGMGELVGPMMKPVQVVGGFMGVLGGLVGIGGAGKYLR